jgi:hypothetical protein
MEKLILNRVAIWQPKNKDDFGIRPVPPGRTYSENSIYRVSEKLMYRYAKNYKVGKGKTAVKFCLFVITRSDAGKKVESFLDSVAQTIDQGYAQKIVATSSMGAFEYTDSYFEEGK